MSGEHILIVEDEPLIAQEIRLKLEASGYKIAGICSSGPQAVEQAAEKNPDLILMDIVLDGAMTGIEAANLIRTKNDIPIVYLTAYADDELLDRAKITDPFGYILKPPIARELHAVISMALYRAASTRKLQVAAYTSAALMSICDAIIIVDVQRHIMEVNPAARKLFHLPIDFAHGSSADDLLLLRIHGKEQSFDKIITDTLAQSKTYVCDNDAATIIINNITIPVHFTISPIIDTTNRTLGAALIVHEYTQRQNAEMALHISKQRLDAIMENTTAVIYIKDRHGHYLMANKQYEEIMGKDINGIIGKSDFDLFPAEIADVLRANDQRILQERRPITFEEHIVQKDGPRDYISAKVPLYDAQGEGHAICGISTDTTNQRRRQRGYTLLNSWAQTLSDRLTHTNIDEQAFYLDVCNGARELVAADIGALPYMDETKTQFTYLAAVGPHSDMLQGKSMSVIGGGLCGWVAQHGKTLCVDDLILDSRIIPEMAHALNVTAALVVPLIQNQIVIGGLSTFRNGTPFDEIDRELLTLYSQNIAISLDNLHLRQSLEHRVSERTAQLAASNDELKAFSYSVSHDLRAPLRRIVGFSNVLLEDFTEQLNTQGQDYLRRLGVSAERMSQLIDDLLALSRVAQVDMLSAQVDLSKMAVEILQELQNTEPQRNIETLIAPELKVQGDTGLLRIALENLLSNAWKFTRDQAIARIEIDCQTQDGETIYSVRDNGAGFDMAYVDKIFDAFQRLHDANVFEGTGIGLATVRRIIHRHNGRVWAEASPGQGATFYFTLGA